MVSIGFSRPAHVLGILALIVAGWGVVAYNVQVQLRGEAVDSHLRAAIDSDAANVYGLLPEYLSHVAPLVESVHIRRLFKSAINVSFSFVPDLGDASGDVIGVTRDSEKVLALAVDNVVSEIAEGSGSAGGRCAVAAPRKFGGPMIGTRTVVVPEDGVYVVNTRRKVGLVLA